LNYLKLSTWLAARPPAQVQSADQGEDGIGTAGSPVIARWTDDGQLQQWPVPFNERRCKTAVVF